MEELVAKAKKGDTQAYTELILQIRNDLYKICKTRINNEDEIDDIVQETMIQTFRHLKSLKDSRKFKSWIITILINNCNRFYKKKKQFNLLNLKYNFEKDIENNRVTDNVETIESDMDFYQLINNLKYEEQIIIILYYSERFTLKEISKILHINENTVKTRLYRAKEKIKLEYNGGVEIG